MKSIILQVFLGSLAIASTEVITPVTEQEITTVREGLNQFSADCGFYPEKLETIFEETKNPPCEAGGGSPPMSPTEENKKLLSKFIYKPSNFKKIGPKSKVKGYQNFELLVRVFSYTNK